MEHLLSAWPEIAAQLRDARHILLLTDFDGTLTPIVERPELADLSDDTRWILQALARQRHITLGVISGRALADLEERVGISGIIYAGNHGLEIEGPGISFVNPMAEELRPIFRIMHYVLGRALGAVRGVLVENKGLSLSIHYRLAERHRSGEVERIIRQVVGGTEASGQARITSGKKVYEVRPTVTWDKGKAIKLLMKKYGKGGRESGLVPMYFGDDLTDEDGFRVIESYGMGISVFVGEQSQPSAARYFLKSPAEVATFLGIMLEQARKGFK
ncbi:MAG: trehalose-phosphatase [Chloroflexi bacterium RBG_16_50_9]|nr:MAG: trehalose-phosphatase [Chloroflexi bacterium RBG_16_50_9]